MKRSFRSIQNRQVRQGRQEMQSAWFSLGVLGGLVLLFESVSSYLVALIQ
jgi:hypothetical protein